MVPARLTFFSFGFIMITRGLRSRSRFGRDRTRRYWRRLPKFRDRNETTYVWSYCSGKFREKFGRNSGRNETTQYHSGNSWMVLKWRISGILGNEIQNFKFGNSRFIFGIETGREMASPEWRYWDRTGGSWKNSVPQTTRPRTQTSKLHSRSSFLKYRSNKTEIIMQFKFEINPAVVA